MALLVYFSALALRLCVTFFQSFLLVLLLPFLIVPNWGAWDQQRPLRNVRCYRDHCCWTFHWQGCHWAVRDLDSCSYFHQFSAFVRFSGISRLGKYRWADMHWQRCTQDSCDTKRRVRRVRWLWFIFAEILWNGRLRLSGDNLLMWLTFSSSGLKFWTQQGLTSQSFHVLLQID